MCSFYVKILSSDFVVWRHIILQFCSQSKKKRIWMYLKLKLKSKGHFNHTWYGFLPYSPIATAHITL